MHPFTKAWLEAFVFDGYKYWIPCMLQAFCSVYAQVWANTFSCKRMLRYIQGTLDFGILYEKNVNAKLLKYCDRNWTGCDVLI